jgi:membrane fusion protein (multidrug efflux system)
VLVELDAEVERAQMASVDGAARSGAAQRASARASWRPATSFSKAQLDDVERRPRPRTTDTRGAARPARTKIIRAPFRGRLGIRAVNVGQYLTPGRW